jgi:small conductance mechanosensitive channel
LPSSEPRIPRTSRRPVWLPTARAALAQDERVLKEPAAVVAVSDYGNTAARFIVRPWCQHDHYWEVRYALPVKLKTAVEAAGYAVPTPQRDIQLINPKQT